MSVARTRARQLVAIAVVAGCYAFVAVEHAAPTAAERAHLAARFAFRRQVLPPAPGRALRTVDQEPVHRGLEHIRAWMTAAGTAVTLGDVDGDGLPNDVCFADTRTDSVVVEPVPGTGKRYRPLMLVPPPRANAEPVTYPTGCLIADLNEDGRADAVVTYATRPPVAFLRDGRGFVAQELVDQPRAVWATGASAVADVDGDGRLDLVFSNYFPDGERIYDPRDRHPIHLNDSFSNARNGGSTHILLFEHATAGPRPSVRFRDIANALPPSLSHGWTLAIAATDLTGDLLPELYLANDFGPDSLLWNCSRPGHLSFRPLEGRRTFFMPKSKTLGHDSFKGMGVDVGDLNGDGLLDIAVSNITSSFAFLESNFLFVNTGDRRAIAHGVAPFTDESEPLGLARSGWSWDVRFGDFDNDGRLELVQAVGFVRGRVDQYPELQESAIANDALIEHPSFWAGYGRNGDVAGHEPNRFWARSRGGRYVDVGREVGLGEGPSRGIATADVNDDGRLDMVIANQWRPSYFYENVCRRCGRYLGLSLRLPLAPRPRLAAHAGHALPGDPRSDPAIGAEIRVVAPDGRAWVGYVDASNGHAGKRAPDVHFGLGSLPRTAALTVDVRYRDPRGSVREARLTLRPGWHTVFLPWSLPRR